MYKLIIYPLLIVILLYANLDLLHNHASLIHYYKYKYAINRATHAAAMQIDSVALAEGVVMIDEEKARIIANDMLKHNLAAQHINGHYNVVMFKVVHVDPEHAPYYYIDERWDIESYFYEPAVIMVIEATYPHMIPIANDTKWNIYGTSQVNTSFK